MLPLQPSTAAARLEQLPDLLSICRLVCHCTASLPAKSITVLVTAPSSLHCSSGHVLLLRSFGVSFADYLVHHLDWELSSRFGRFFLPLTLRESCRHTAPWKGLKAVFFPSLQRTCLSMSGRGWTHISRIQENYLQFSGSSQTFSKTSVLQSLSLASVLMSVSLRGGIWQNKCICAEVL